MNRRIRRLGIALVALFGLLFVQVAYVQVFAADRDRDNPANATRQIIAEYKVERGQILTRGRHGARASSPADGPERDSSIRAALPAGPAVRRHHRATTRRSTAAASWSRP